MISHSAGAGLPHRNPQTQTLVVNPGRPLPSSPGSAAGPITGLWGPFLGLQTGCCLQNQPLHPLSKHLPAGFFFFFFPLPTQKSVYPALQVRHLPGLPRRLISKLFQSASTIQLCALPLGPRASPSSRTGLSCLCCAFCFLTFDLCLLCPTPPFPREPPHSPFLPPTQA